MADNGEANEGLVQDIREIRRQQGELGKEQKEQGRKLHSLTEELEGFRRDQTVQNRYVFGFLATLLTVLLAIIGLSIFDTRDLVSTDELKQILQPLHPDKVFVENDGGEIIALTWPLSVRASYLTAKPAAAGDGSVAIENSNPNIYEAAPLREVLGGEVVQAAEDPAHPGFFEVKVRHDNGMTSTYGRLSQYDKHKVVVGERVYAGMKLGTAIPASPVCVTYRLERRDGTVVEGLVDAFRRALDEE